MGRQHPGRLRAKELHHILRDRQTLAILLLMPLVQVLFFGYALRTDIRDLRVAMVDPTPDVVTLRLRNRLVATTRFHLVNVSSTSTVMDGLFQRRVADIAVVLPRRSPRSWGGAIQRRCS